MKKKQRTSKTRALSAAELDAMQPQGSWNRFEEQLWRTIEQLRADKERMDWLSENPTDVGGFMGAERARFWGFYGKQSQTLREVIDEARAYQRTLKVRA